MTTLELVGGPHDGLRQDEPFVPVSVCPRSEFGRLCRYVAAAQVTAEGRHVMRFDGYVAASAAKGG